MFVSGILSSHFMCFLSIKCQFIHFDKHGHNSYASIRTVPVVRELSVTSFKLVSGPQTIKKT